MPDKTGPKDLEMVLAKLKEEWRELADLLSSQSKSQDRVIEVEKILLLDASGRYRGKISANPDGSADLLLSDRSGTAWARLGVSRDGEAFLQLKDRQGKSSFKAGVGAPSPGTGPGPATAPGDASNFEAPQLIESPGVSPQSMMPGAAEGEPLGESGSGPSSPTPSQDLNLGRDADFGALDRLEKLERQNRRQKMYWALILAVLGLILATQAYVLFRPLRSVLPGEGLEVRDTNGRVRVSLGLGLQGAPHLAFYDGEQRVRAELNLGPDGEPQFTLRDKRSLQGKTEPNDFSDSSHRPQRGKGGPGTAASPPTGPAETVSPNRNAEAEIEVVGSKTSNKYHLPTCKWVQGIKPWNLIKFKSPGEAQSRHYIPCPTCKPPPLSR
jgi:hypothetical protein